MIDRLPMLCDDPAAFRDEQTRRKAAEARVEELTDERDRYRTNMCALNDCIEPLKAHVEDLESENEKLRANLADLVAERDDLGKALYGARQQIERADAELAKLDAKPAPVDPPEGETDTDLLRLLFTRIGECETDAHAASFCGWAYAIIGNTLAGRERRGATEAARAPAVPRDESVPPPAPCPPDSTEEGWCWGEDVNGEWSPRYYPEDTVMRWGARIPWPDNDDGGYAPASPPAAPAPSPAEALARIGQWTHEYGAALNPTGCADTYGEGMRAAKRQVALLLEVAPTPSQPAELVAALHGIVSTHRREASACDLTVATERGSGNERLRARNEGAAEIHREIVREIIAALASYGAPASEAPSVAAMDRALVDGGIITTDDLLRRVHELEASETALRDALETALRDLGGGDQRLDVCRDIRRKLDSLQAPGARERCAKGIGVDGGADG